MRRPGFVSLLVAGGTVAILPPALIHFVGRDQVQLSSETHFWSVSLSAALATAAGVALSYGGWRRCDARAALPFPRFPPPGARVQFGFCSCSRRR